MRRFLLAVLVAVAPAALAAQVIPAGARAAGLGDNYGVLARGFGAGYWNPANLGQRGNPAFSLELPGVGISASADPLKLSEIKKWGGDTLTNAVKQQWLDDIGPNGSLELRTGAHVTEAGLSIGPVALTTGTTIGLRGDLPHDAVAAVLYGNGGPSGAGDTLSFTNGALQAFAVSHVGLSLGIPIGVHITHAEDERFSVGVTAKYVMGHGLLDARDGVGQLTIDSASVRFTTVALYDEGNAINGTGMGFDLGAAWTSGKLSAGLTLYDIANSFRFKDQGKVGSLHAFVSPDFERRELEPGVDRLRHRHLAAGGGRPREQRAVPAEPAAFRRVPPDGPDRPGRRLPAPVHRSARPRDPEGDHDRTGGRDPLHPADPPPSRDPLRGRGHVVFGGGGAQAGAAPHRRSGGAPYLSGYNAALGVTIGAW